MDGFSDGNSRRLIQFVMSLPRFKCSIRASFFYGVAFNFYSIRNRLISLVQWKIVFCLHWIAETNAPLEIEVMNTLAEILNQKWRERNVQSLLKKDKWGKKELCLGPALIAKWTLQFFFFFHKSPPRADIISIHNINLAMRFILFCGLWLFLNPNVMNISIITRNLINSAPKISFHSFSIQLLINFSFTFSFIMIINAVPETESFF